MNTKCNIYFVPIIYQSVYAHLHLLKKKKIWDTCQGFTTKCIYLKCACFACKRMSMASFFLFQPGGKNIVIKKTCIMDCDLVSPQDN